jgi:flagellar P-ring protein FlgI
MAHEHPIRYQSFLITMQKPTIVIVLFSLVLVVMPVSPVDAARIQELCDIKGVRPNQLVGYGLVVGLNGSGDSGQARFTIQSTAAILRRLGATIDPGSIKTKNAAAVMVTTNIPAYIQPGSRIDVTVSSLGNARSLEGGTLIQTPLYAADRRVYAVAQGPLLVGGFSEGQGGSSVRQNHPTVGRIPQGAIVEQRPPTPALDNKALVLQLRVPSFVTAQRIVEVINGKFGKETAKAVDSGTVNVRMDLVKQHSPVALLAAIQTLDVEPDAPVRVVIDERTGTVVLGAGISIAEVAVAQGGLSIQIEEQKEVSQPNALSMGETKEVRQTTVSAQVATGSLHHVPATASLAEVVAALNALGAKPRDLIAILQALRTAGALRAEIEVQ